MRRNPLRRVPHGGPRRALHGSHHHHRRPSISSDTAHPESHFARWRARGNREAEELGCCQVHCANEPHDVVRVPAPPGEECYLIANVFVASMVSSKLMSSLTSMVTSDLPSST